MQDGKPHRMHRGVYAVGHEALTWEGQCLAAVLANEPAVASHVSAGWIWGLLRSRPGTFHVTAPTRRHGKDRVDVHFARLEAEDVTTVEGIPVTSPARTVLDLAPNPRRDLAKLLRRADDLKLLDRRWFEALLSPTRVHPAGPSSSPPPAAGNREPVRPLPDPVNFADPRSIVPVPGRPGLGTEHVASAGGAPMGDPRGAQAALPPSTVGEIGGTGPAAATPGPLADPVRRSGRTLTCTDPDGRRPAPVGPRRSVA